MYFMISGKIHQSNINHNIYEFTIEQRPKIVTVIMTVPYAFTV